MRKLPQGTIRRGSEDLEGQGYTEQEARQIRNFGLRRA